MDLESYVALPRDSEDGFEGHSHGEIEDGPTRSSQKSELATGLEDVKGGSHRVDRKFMNRLWLLVRRILSCKAEKWRINLFGQGFGWVHRKFSRSSPVSTIPWPPLVVALWTILSSVPFLLFGATLFKIYTDTQVGQVASSFFKTLDERDGAGFVSLVRRAGLVLVGAAILEAFISYLDERMRLSWRGKLTFMVHKQYLQNRNFYTITNLDTRIDNPDNRISHDIDQFSTTFTSLFSKSIQAPFSIAWYSYYSYDLLGFVAPASVLAFFMIGCFVNHVVMNILVGYVFLQDRLEGNFRYDHSNIRKHAESIAFYKGESFEKGTVDRSLTSLLQNQERLINRHLVLNVVGNTLSKYGGILNYCILAIPLFVGDLGGLAKPLGDGNIASTISLASFYCFQLIYSFTQLLQLAPLLSEVAGCTARVAQLFEVLDEFDNMTGNDFASIFNPDNLNCAAAQRDTVHSPNSAPSLLLKSFAFYIPGGKRVVQGLDLCVIKGENLLIEGPSGKLIDLFDSIGNEGVGCGKSSLLRVLAGLWPYHEGSLTVTGPHERSLSPIFIPQQPYVFKGSLREQIFYPLEVNFRVEEANLKSILVDVRLDHWLDKVSWDDVVDFDAQMSPGEKQRLAFARAFFRQPDFLCLDESTSSLGLTDEEHLYKLCQQMGITAISVGHRPSLHKMHSSVLVLDGLGGYQVKVLGTQN